MALDKIVLVSNPGSTSRKYSLYKGTTCLSSFHFEVVDNKVMCTDISGKQTRMMISHVTFAATLLPKMINIDLSDIRSVGLRVVAPSSFFQRSHVIDRSVITRLEKLRTVAPLHIDATLSEYQLLKAVLPKAVFVGISDSAFLAQKPDYAMYYGIPMRDAKRLDIRRFGYHGLSLRSVVSILSERKTLPHRMVVCHLGGGASVAALRRGKVIDSTMGFSPLEGVLMATRSGTMDIIAFDQIKNSLKLRDGDIDEYLNNDSGLLGISGISGDIRELLAREQTTVSAKLALDMYVYKIQQAIGAMVAALGGVEAIVFTGTVGERSAEIRKRILSNFLYLGFELDGRLNKLGLDDSSVASLGKNSNAKIYTIHGNEELMIAKEVAELT